MINLLIEAATKIQGEWGDRDPLVLQLIEAVEHLKMLGEERCPDSFEEMAKELLGQWVPPTIAQKAELEVMLALQAARKKFEELEPLKVKTFFDASPFHATSQEIQALSRELRNWNGKGDEPPVNEYLERLVMVMEQAECVVECYRAVELDDTCKADTQFFCAIEALAIMIREDENSNDEDVEAG